MRYIQVVCRKGEELEMKMKGDMGKKVKRKKKASKHQTRKIYL
jgi:hypothetical protein